MDHGNEELIIRATASLALQDISLVRAHFERPADVQKGTELIVQEKRAVNFIVDADQENGHKLLRVRVDLGTRYVAKADQSVIFSVIEADYVVDYRITAELPEEAMKAFAEFNAVHNVWPFWRQHVFDIVDKARLPRIEIPFFAGRKI